MFLHVVRHETLVHGMVVMKGTFGMPEEDRVKGCIHPSRTWRKCNSAWNINKEKRVTEDEAGSGHRSDCQELVKYFEGLKLTPKSHWSYAFFFFYFGKRVAYIVSLSRKIPWALSVHGGRCFGPSKIKDSRAQAGLWTWWPNQMAGLSYSHPRPRIPGDNSI